MSFLRLLLLTMGTVASAIALSPPDAAAQPARPVASRAVARRPPPQSAAASGTIQAIRITGNARIEPGTIRSYMLVAPGDPFDSDRIDRSLKTLYATGLFQDVTITRQGQDLLVTLVENPIVDRVVFEGNHKITDDQLRQGVQLKSRSVFTAALAQSDREHILDAYARKGRFDARVEPKIIHLDQNRVDVVFEISEGDSTLISRIAFVGNHAFSESELRDVINSRETEWWRFLSTSDSYDPERIRFDREQLRRFYLRHGYADVEITDASAEITPDRSSFFVTYTINEGERYKIGAVTINSTLRTVEGKSVRGDIEQESGDWYDGDAVERSVNAITEDIQARGIAFVEVKPRIARDKAKHIVDLAFDIGEGPRVYVERLDIVGNTRTEDKVIRRELRIAEGDAFNAAAMRRSRQRLQDLGYFSSVDLNNSPGSAADKAVITANIAEKATGELTLGGGYSTDAGFLVNVGLRERNLLGTGIDASIDGVLAQKRSSIDFSVTDPYFLDRNLVGGFDLFYVNTDNLQTAQYSERRFGGSLRTGFAYTDHLSQSFTYTVVDRDVYNVNQDDTVTSYYIRNQAGESVLSQIGQAVQLDFRDSRVDPHTGFNITAGTDFAGLGGDSRFVRAKVDGVYFIPLDVFTGNSDWGFSVSAGTGYFFNLGNQERIIDRFFLGGDNLRGFQSGGAGPHDPVTGDSLGGRFLWSQSTELHFPLPISPDIGLSGRSFVDVGALSQGKFESKTCPGSGYPLQQPGNVLTTGGTACPSVYDTGSPRVGAGVGVSWKTPFGLINLDIADAVVKSRHDQTQVFRFGFGTRF